MGSKTNFLRLECTTGNHNKFYEIWLESKSIGYTVCFQYGRIGTAGVGGAKVKDVSYSTAMATLNDLKYEKQAKGYQIVSDAGDGAEDTKPKKKNPILTGVPVTMVKDEGQFEVMQPTAWPQEEVDELLDDENWGMQEKKNGKFLRTSFLMGTYTAYNKLGKKVVLPKGTMDGLREVSEKVSFALDGELIKDTYHVFDLYKYKDLKGSTVPTRTRYESAAELVAQASSLGGDARLVPMYFGADKRSMYNELVGLKVEGFVFKRLVQIYVPGKVEDRSKAVSVKVKLWKEISAIASGWNKGKQSVSLDLYEWEGGQDYKLTTIGSLTVPEKYAKQLKDTPLVVRVRYLYATKENQLYQATLDPDDSGSVVRDDIDLENYSALNVNQLQKEGDGFQPKRSILI